MKSLQYTFTAVPLCQPLAWRVSVDPRNRAPAAEIVLSLCQAGGTETPSETQIADLWDWEGDQITTCAKMQTYPWGSKTEGTVVGRGTNLSTNYDTGQDNKCDPSAAFLGKNFSAPIC